MKYIIFIGFCALYISNYQTICNFMIILDATIFKHYCFRSMLSFFRQSWDNNLPTLQIFYRSSWQGNWPDAKRKPILAKPGHFDTGDFITELCNCSNLKQSRKLSWANEYGIQFSAVAFKLRFFHLLRSKLSLHFSCIIVGLIFVETFVF